MWTTTKTRSSKSWTLKAASAPSDDGGLHGRRACDPSGMRYGASVSIDNISLGAAVYEQDSTGVYTRQVEHGQA